MHTAEYKFQVGQIVFIIDTDDDELQRGQVLQATIDIYQDSNQTLVFDNTYIVHLLDGIECSENIECPERVMYETLSEAAAALEAHIGDA